MCTRVIIPAPWLQFRHQGCTGDTKVTLCARGLLCRLHGYYLSIRVALEIPELYTPRLFCRRPDCSAGTIVKVQGPGLLCMYHSYSAGLRIDRYEPGFLCMHQCYTLHGPELHWMHQGCTAGTRVTLQAPGLVFRYRVSLQFLGKLWNYVEMDSRKSTLGSLQVS